MLVMWLAVVVLVIVTVQVHYEALRGISFVMARWHPRVRSHLIPMMIAIIFARLIEVAIFAVGFYVVAEGFGEGALEGKLGGTYRDYLYHSAVSYTSLGLGDVFPTGHLRLLTGVEALTGLLMITWSASFTYLEMTKTWNRG
jgi:hypothetical protein